MTTWSPSQSCARSATPDRRKTVTFSNSTLQKVAHRDQADTVRRPG